MSCTHMIFYFWCSFKYLSSFFLSVSDFLYNKEFSRRNTFVMYVCDEKGCIYESSNWHVWADHVRDKHSLLSCTVVDCYRSFVEQRYYRQHYKEQHKEGHSTYMCSLCFDPFKQKRGAKLHCEKRCKVGKAQGKIGVVLEVPAVLDVTVPVMVGFNKDDLGVVLVKVSGSLAASHSFGVAPVDGGRMNRTALKSENRSGP